MSQDASSLGPMLEQDDFHRSLFACSLQIVLFAYDSLSRRPTSDSLDSCVESHTDFPFVLRVCEVQSYYFYRVIELVVRSEPGLTREVVKHLNAVEETVLESLAWDSGSPVWAALKQYSDSASSSSPSCDDVSLSKSQLASEKEISSNGKDKTATEEEAFPQGAKKITIHVQSQQADQTVMVPVEAMMIPSEDGGYSIQLVGNKTKLCENGLDKKRHKALFLFYRKVYHMASLRLRDLSSRLDVNRETMEQAWTLFCSAFRADGSSVMRGRHLDQILICALYAISKLSTRAKLKPLTFQDIMKSYRIQPQFQSHVYRSVLLSPGDIASDSTTDESRDNLPRGDLISFYNKVFVRISKSNIASIVKETDGSNLCHLPEVHPLNVPGEQSSRRLSDQHSIFVCPRPGLLGCPPTTGNKLSYRFAKSPKRDLRAINIMIRRGEAKLRAPSIGLSATASNRPFNSTMVTNLSALTPSMIAALNSKSLAHSTNSNIGASKIGHLRNSLPASVSGAVKNLAFETPDFDEEEEEMEEEEEEDEYEEDEEEYLEEIAKKRLKLTGDGGNSATMEQLQAIMASLPKEDGETQFEIVIDGSEGSETKVLRVNSAGEVFAPSSAAPSFVNAAATAAAAATPTHAADSTTSGSEMQHFVTFDEKGREIHFVAPASSSSSTSSSASQATVSANPQNASPWQEVVQIPNGTGYQTVVVGDNNVPLQSLTHVLNDNVAVLNDDGLVLDKVASDGTFYQLVTEDGSTVVTD